MILDGNELVDGNRATFDDLFRRAGVRHADALALVDPPNSASITGCAPRKLTYAQADRAISALAVKLRGLGLQTDAVVAMQLANTADSVIALLGVLRAGMIAAPLPLLWRKQEMVTALSRTATKAIVTYGGQADIAMQVAAELFPIRHICGFGRDLPDGVVPLDDCVGSTPVEFFQPSARSGDAGAHVAIITFDVDSDGIAPFYHSHNELIVNGLAVFREASLAESSTIVSTIPPTSLAGLAVTVVPWLLVGGTLALHHSFDPVVFAAQGRTHDISTVVLPGPALTPLADAGLLGGQIKTILALWRAPEQLVATASWQGHAALIDIASFGETGLLPARRGPDGLPKPVMSDAVQRGGTGLVAVGGYRFRQREVDAAVAAADPAAVIVALPNALLGQRLAGSACDRAAAAAELQAHGVNALIAGAFRPLGSA